MGEWEGKDGRERPRSGGPPSPRYDSSGCSHRKPPLVPAFIPKESTSPSLSSDSVPDGVIPLMSLVPPGSSKTSAACARGAQEQTASTMKVVGGGAAQTYHRISAAFSHESTQQFCC